MSHTKVDRLCEYLRVRSFEHERVGDEIRAFLPKSVSVHVRAADGPATYRVRFGVMAMAAEMTLSISFFAVLLIICVLIEDPRYPYLPFLGPVAFLGNLFFELSRYRIAKNFIEDVRHVI